MTTPAPTFSAPARSMFCAEFLSNVEQGEYFVVYCGDFDREGSGGTKQLTPEMVEEVVADIIRDNERHGMKIPSEYGVDASMLEVYECLSIRCEEVVTIISRTEMRRKEAKNLEKYMTGLNLRGTPGSPEWFDDLSLRIDAEVSENSGERRAERWGGVMMGAQTEEGYYSDCDYASEQASKLQEVLDWAADNLPLSYALWEESKRA